MAASWSAISACMLDAVGLVAVVMLGVMVCRVFEVSQFVVVEKRMRGASALPVVARCQS